MQRILLSALVLVTAVACRDAGPTDPQALTVSVLGVAVPYQTVDLGTLGGSSSVATDINDNGQIVGYSATGSGVAHAFRWQDGVMTDLGTLGGDWSEATDVNAVGQVAGRSADAAGESRAFLWTDGVVQDLGPAVRYFAVRLNARGQVTWSAPQPDGTAHAMLWTDGVAKDLGTLGGTSQARAINDLGQVAGQSNDHAFLWDGSVMQDLGSLGNSAWAADVNNQGQVVGASYTPGPEPTLHALLWNNGQVTDLGTTAGDPNAHAVAINEGGQVAGVSLDLGYERGKPFRWQAGVLLPLRPVDDGAAMTETVVAMNQNGVVVGNRTLRHYYQAVVSENGARWELPALSDSGTVANGINRESDVVGVSGADFSTQHAVLWRRVPTVAVRLPEGWRRHS